MRKLLLAFAASALVACQNDTSPSSVTVTAAVSAPSLRLGTPVSISLKIHNGGDETIHLSISPCDRPFEVLDFRGRVVGPAPVQVCTLALTAPITIEPGASAQYSTMWSGDIGFGPADEIIYARPGSYFIRPRVLVQENSFVYGDAITLTVTSAQ
jgi:hypothetical protein